MFICEELAINNIWCCFCWWCHSRYLLISLVPEFTANIIIPQESFKGSGEVREGETSPPATNCNEAEDGTLTTKQKLHQRKSRTWFFFHFSSSKDLFILCAFLFIINYTLFYYHPIKVEYNWKYFYTNVDLTLSIISIHLSTQIFSQNNNIHYKHIIVKDIIPFIKCHFQTTIFESSCTEKYFLLFCNL